MQEKYINYIQSFKKLCIEDKQEEIINSLNEFKKFTKEINYKLDINKTLPVLQNYENDSEFLDVIFTYIVSLKEENKYLIEKLIKEGHI